MSDKSLSQKKYIVTTAEICEILGLSARRIQQLTKEGSLVRISHGKYDLPLSIKTYIEYASEVPEEELDKAEEETLWTRARRQKTELELKIMKGEVHRSEDVETVMNDMLASFRAQMLVIPGKVAPQLLGMKDVEILKDMIKSHIYEALQELSDYDPETFYSRSTDKLTIEETEQIASEEKKVAEKRPRKNANKQN